MKADYAKRGYHYVKNYGLSKLYLKARERLERDVLEKDYQQWMIAERPADSEKELQREHRFAYAPKISVVVPVYKTPEVFLREMVDSVLGQTYGNVELCLADGSEEDHGPQKILEAYAAQDSRVRYEKLPKNLGIAGNTNAALDLATGEYVALLDHDDFLEEHALFEMVKWLQTHPEADMIYTDEDKVSFDSATFFQPHFKPDFNPDLLRTNNYICHFLMVKRTLMEQAGKYRESFDGAQDYDFILRCSELAQEIDHIPRVLYHWRCHPASTAGNPESKMYAYEAGRRALEGHLERTGVSAAVQCMDNPGFYRVCYMPTETPKVSIVLLNVPDAGTLKRLVKVISRQNGYSNYEILVLLETPKKNKIILNFIKEHRQTPIKVVYCNSACNKFVTFSSLAEKMDSDYLLFLDGRTGNITRGFMELFLGSAQRADIGAVGGRVYDDRRRLWHGIKVLGLKGTVGDAFEGLKAGYTGYFHKAILQQNCHAVSGKAMMLRRELFLKAGGFSEDVEDRMKNVDLCLKLEKLGYRNVYEPGIAVILQDHQRGRKQGIRPAAQFTKKWKSLLQMPDRFYNSNLSLDNTDFRIRDYHRRED